VLDDDEIRSLLGIAPPGFVAARNRAVKELRAAGRRGDAAALGALRRVHPAEWALNVEAAADPAAVAAFADAAGRVLAAQASAMAGEAADGLRPAMVELRSITGELAAAVARRLAGEGLAGGGTSAPQVASRLTALAANPTALSLLRRGLLGAEDPGLADPFGGPGPAVAPAASDAPAAIAAPVDLAAERERRRARGSAERGLVEAKAAADAAAAAAAKAATMVAKAQRRVAEAEERLAAEREVLDAAREEQRQLDAQHAAALEAVDAAAAAVERAGRDRGR